MITAYLTRVPDWIWGSHYGKKYLNLYRKFAQKVILQKYMLLLYRREIKFVYCKTIKIFRYLFIKNRLSNFLIWYSTIMGLSHEIRIGLDYLVDFQWYWDFLKGLTHESRIGLDYLVEHLSLEGE